MAATTMSSALGASTSSSSESASTPVTQGTQASIGKGTSPAASQATTPSGKFTREQTVTQQSPQTVETSSPFQVEGTAALTSTAGSAIAGGSNQNSLGHKHHTHNYEYSGLTLYFFKLTPFPIQKALSHIPNLRLTF